MHSEEFFERVRTAGDLDSDADARDAALATLETLGERIGGSQAEELAADLPDEPADPLVEATPDEAEGFSLDQFVERVADRTGTDGDDALVRVRAVVTALREAASEDEVEDARSQLPDEFDLVFGGGEFVTADEFAERVRQRAGLATAEQARDVALAVVETLGERLSEGEAADLGTYLPGEFREAVTRRSQKEPPEFGYEAFLERTAERAGVADAESHAQAVLGVVGVLSEIVGDEEFEKLRSQLPAEYDELFEAVDGSGE